MHVRVRFLGKPEVVIAVESKLTKIEYLRMLVKGKFDVEPQFLRLMYGGKLLEDGYSLYDYKIKLNDVIQAMQMAVQQQCVTPTEDLEPTPNIRETESDDDGEENEDLTEYTDAVSVLYEIGDLVDVRQRKAGSWFEAKIVRIVYDPDRPASQETDTESEFSQESMITDKNLLYKVENENGSRFVLAKLDEVRPRARHTIEMKDLKVGQVVMVDYSIENPDEKGYWYDMKISAIFKYRTKYMLSGTLYLEENGTCTEDVEKIEVKDKIYKIETVIPLAQRTEADKALMKTVPEPRTQPLLCKSCKDDEDSPCRDCGCFVCASKQDPNKIILCDECDNGYHISCLEPPLETIPSDDWYCPSCKRDPNEIVAPGGSKQKKRTTKTGGRDWGRGMACIGKTKDCSLPRNHFGPIPGVEVGMRWCYRIQLSEIGLHRPPVSGIHGRDTEGAYSLVLSGGYEDDVDNGDEFTYTGSGGRDLSGNRRTASQSSDQTLTRENRALARNCAVSSIDYEGGDAGDDWRKGKPVRVSRSCKMLKHFPKYAPKDGIRYDGIYKVVKYYPEAGQSGFMVWKYLLRRDDPSPAPWEPEAKTFPIVYPDNFLEAQEEKKRLKLLSKKTDETKKLALEENNSNVGESSLTESNSCSTSSSSSDDTSNSDNNISVNNNDEKTVKQTKKTLTKKHDVKIDNESDSVTTSSLTKNTKDKKTNGKSSITDFFRTDSKKSKEKDLTPVDDTSKKSRNKTQTKTDTKIKMFAKVSRRIKDNKTRTESDESTESDVAANNARTRTSKRTRKACEVTSTSKENGNMESSSSSSDDKDTDKVKLTKHTAKKRTLEEIKSPKNGKVTTTYEEPALKKSKNDMWQDVKIHGDRAENKTDNTPLAASKLAATPKESVLSTEELKAIKIDTANVKKWEECIDIANSKGRMEFINMVMETFCCAICHSLVKTPITTPCLHNFCMACMKSLINRRDLICPCCRSPLKDYKPESNTDLTSALNCILGKSV